VADPTAFAPNERPLSPTASDAVDLAGIVAGTADDVSALATMVLTLLLDDHQAEARALLAELGHPAERARVVKAAIALITMAVPPLPANALAYRRRRPDVRAVQWTGSNAEAVIDLAGARFAAIAPEDRPHYDPTATASLLGPDSLWLDVHDGDWIVRQGDEVARLSDADFWAEFEFAGPAPVDEPPPPAPAASDPVTWLSPSVARVNLDADGANHA
jgi:hypothetical protein